jgi:hypothetical protein
VPVAFRDHGQQAPGDRRNLRVSDSRLDAVIDDGLHVFVPQHLRAGRERGRGLRSDAPGVLRFRYPPRDALADVQAAQPRLDHFAREKVALHEPAEGARHAVFVRGDDRRVRYPDAERMAKQRGHGEPVRETANHRGLRGRAHVSQPRVLRLKHARDHEDDRRRDEQTRCAVLHLAQTALSLQLVGDWRRLHEEPRLHA